MHKSNWQRNGQINSDHVVSKFGNVQWRLDNIRLLSADENLAFESGHLYCIATRDKSYKASFYAIDAEYGRISWSIELENVSGSLQQTEYSVFSAPVIINQLAYFLYQPTEVGLNPILFCIDTQSQKVKFLTDIHVSMGKQFVEGTMDFFKQWLRTSPLVVEGCVYIGTGNGRICAFDAETGVLEWIVAITDDFAIGHIAYADGFLYAQTGSRDLYALDIDKKAVHWKFEHGEEPNSFINWYDICPLVLNDIVYLYGSLNNIYAVERKTGKLRWKYGVSGKYPCRNFVATQTSLVGAMPDSMVHAIDAMSGQRVWTADLDNPITGKAPSVTIDDTLLISGGGLLSKVNTVKGKIEEQWNIPFSLKAVSNPIYVVMQLLYLVVTGSPGFSYISSPCVTEKGIFVAANKNGLDYSIYKVSTQA